jgi:hypothetical protein
LLEFERGLDELIKLNNLPYWQQAPAIREWMANSPAFKRLPDDPRFFTPMAFLPSLSRIYLSRARVERRIAALRCIEAIRLHATGRRGELPVTLDEIKDVPIPVDPFTGKLFEYKADGNKAVLSSAGAAVSGLQGESGDALVYEIAIKK